MHKLLTEDIMVTYYYALKTLNTIAKISGTLKIFGDRVINGPETGGEAFQGFHFVSP